MGEHEYSARSSTTKVDAFSEAIFSFFCTQGKKSRWSRRCGQKKFTETKKTIAQKQKKEEEKMCFSFNTCVIPGVSLMERVANMKTQERKNFCHYVASYFDTGAMVALLRRYKRGFAGVLVLDQPWNVFWGSERTINWGAKMDGSWVLLEVVLMLPIMTCAPTATENLLGSIVGMDSSLSLSLYRDYYDNNLAHTLVYAFLHEPRAIALDAFSRLIRWVASRPDGKVMFSAQNWQGLTPLLICTQAQERRQSSIEAMSVLLQTGMYTFGTWKEIFQQGVNMFYKALVECAMNPDVRRCFYTDWSLVGRIRRIYAAAGARRGDSFAADKFRDEDKAYIAFELDVHFIPDIANLILGYLSPHHHHPMQDHEIHERKQRWAASFLHDFDLELSSSLLIFDDCHFYRPLEHRKQVILKAPPLPHAKQIWAPPPRPSLFAGTRRNQTAMHR